MLFVIVVQQLLSTPHCAAFCPFFSSPCDILHHFLLQLSRVTAILEVAIIPGATSAAPLDENDDDIMRMIHGRKAIILLNKADLDTILDKEMIEKKYIEVNTSEGGNAGASECPAVIEISAKSGHGISELEQTLKEMFFEGKISFNDEIYITNVRHKTALNHAYEALK